MAPKPEPTASRPDRASLKTMVAFVRPEVSKEVKQAALDMDATVQIVFERAIMQFLKRYKAKDKETIADLREAAGMRPATGPKPVADQAYKPA